jgi:CheY-like chemotaxis protein
MRCVLVVDDDQLFARTVGRDLAEHGFSVCVAHDTAAALTRLGTGGVDVLVTDLQLGSEDGIELLEASLAVSPRTRGILMSAFASARDSQRAHELGAITVLCKPFTPAQLIQCVRQAVECETGFRGSVHGLSLIDMLQMFHYGRRSVSICVAGERAARVLMHEGRIVHVEHGGRVGEPALETLLAMPAGALSTSVLPASYETSVTRDFQGLLLDALRTMDEGARSEDAIGEHALDPVFGQQTFDRLRQIEGYVASCVARVSTGSVIGHDGALDLRIASEESAAVLRRASATAAEMGLDEALEEILVTSMHEYHLLRSLRSDVFVHLVVERSRTNPAMAKLALAKAVSALDV